MRLVSSAAITFDWIDRNPIDLTELFAGAIVNNIAATSRFSYTVPASRRVYIGSVLCSINCSIVGVALDWGQCFINVTPLAGTPASVAFAFIEGTTVNIQQVTTQGAGSWFGAGTVVEGFTQTATATATFSVSMSATLLEFDV